MRDHSPVSVDTFRGTFDRGEDESVPTGFFIDSRNIRFITGGFATRYGTTSTLTIANIRRIAVYKRIGEAQRLLILTSGGLLFDSVVSLSTPILSIAAMSDFSMSTIFNRAYITPHNGLTGLPGEKVYVYSGSGTAIPAAGTAPSAFTLGLANSASSGSVETGVHAIGVCFQTATGFITAPGGFQQINASGAKKIDVTLLPIGGANVVARVLVATRILTNFVGDFANQTYYFVPNGTISDNVAIATTIDFFDADLQEDATYLLEQLSIIPAGVGISLYKGRMVTWGEDANNSVVRVSKSGEPESFNEVEGFITVNPGDSGGGVKNVTEYRTMLVMFKSQRCYASQDDNINEAAFWSVNQVDMSVGCECHGLGRSLDFGENIQDHLFVADRAGLRLFGGTFSPEGIVTYNFDDQWSRINQAAFHTIEVAIDPIESKLYVAVPLDSATSPSHIFFGDYSEGLTTETIKWTCWSFPWAPQSVVVDVVASVTVPKFGAYIGNVYKYDPGAILDTLTAIDHWVEFPLFPVGSEDEYIYSHTGCRVRVKGSGVLDISLRGLDSALTLNAQSLTLALAPGRSLFRGFNFVSERAAVKLRMDGPNEFMTMTKFIQYMAILWEDRPAE